MRFVVAIALVLTVSGPAYCGSPVVDYDSARHEVFIQDGAGRLALRVNTDKRCLIDSVKVNDIEVVHGEFGVCSAILFEDQWFSTRKGIASPTVKVEGDTVRISSIRFGDDKMPVEETWILMAGQDAVEWGIERTYKRAGTLQDTCFAGWDFADMNTWTGALLDNGGVAWCRFLEEPNMTLGNHAGEVTFWNRANDIALRITPTVPAGRQMAVRFSHEPNGAFAFAQNIGDTEFDTKHDLSRFIRGRQDVWESYEQDAETIRVDYTLKAMVYSEEYDLGELKGVDEETVREIFNTILRYGVVDRDHTGGNGWRTGWICLHEQWYSSMAAAMGNRDYTRNVSSTYDYFGQHAVKEDGRVLARFKNDKGDYKPSGYTEKGFFEPGWGILMDSQPDYVIVVSEQFHNTADMGWLRGQKETCERVLDFLLKRDHDDDGLLEMMNDYHTDGQGSDWIDVIWAAHENAFVNAEMYHAMALWAELEELMGDAAMARKYEQAAAKLRARFNLDVADGGFWNADEQWYVYWRDRDDSIHGDNLVVPVNFMAIAYGVCTDGNRRAAILDRLEAEMVREGLFSWPLCVFPYREDEGKENNFPFPNYENGDLFLSWNGLGVDVYADHNPAIAMKYVRGVLNRYDQDGLAYQRYTRLDAKGEGNDILSGNGNAIVGLYLSIYGIQPRHDRLYLNPHLTPELHGTMLKYRLRDKDYAICLDANRYAITTDGQTIIDDGAFGFSADRGLGYFRGVRGNASLIADHTGPLTLDMTAWEPARPAWTTTCPTDKSVTFNLEGLQPSVDYEILLRQADRTGRNVKRTDANGVLSIRVEHAGNVPVEVSCAAL